MLDLGFDLVTNQSKLLLVCLYGFLELLGEVNAPFLEQCSRFVLNVSCSCVLLFLLRNYDFETLHSYATHGLAVTLLLCFFSLEMLVFYFFSSFVERFLSFLLFLRNPVSLLLHKQPMRFSFFCKRINHVLKCVLSPRCLLFSAPEEITIVHISLQLCLLADQICAFGKRLGQACLRFAKVTIRA